MSELVLQARSKARLIAIRRPELPKGIVIPPHELEVYASAGKLGPNTPILVNELSLASIYRRQRRYQQNWIT